MRKEMYGGGKEQLRIQSITHHVSNMVEVVWLYVHVWLPMERAHQRLVTMWLQMEVVSAENVCDGKTLMHWHAVLRGNWKKCLCCWTGSTATCHRLMSRLEYHSIAISLNEQVGALDKAVNSLTLLCTYIPKDRARWWNALCNLWWELIISCARIPLIDVITYLQHFNALLSALGGYFS